MKHTIGIDVSKDKLDAHKLVDGEYIEVGNNAAGFKRLLKWIGNDPDVLIVFESTGAYHRELEQMLGVKTISFVKVNPKQARRFAQATGRLAKTDRVDAVMLARMGVALELSPQVPHDESLYELRDLLTARRALMKDRTAAKTRLLSAIHRLVKRQLNLRLKQIVSDIKKIDASLCDYVDQDEVMKNQVEILCSIPGIGSLTAITILIDMPEIGILENKQIASLAGLAPISQSSGKWQGKERIQGGRALVRRAIYMPALVAARINPDLKTKYQQLVQAGKPKKVALTAIMRKLIILANTLLRDNRKWVSKTT